MEPKGKQQTVFEGRRARQDATITGLNELNESQKEWHYAIAETHPAALQDSVSMLERDGFEVVPEEDAAKLGLVFGASSRRVLMRVDKRQSDAYRKEALEMAAVSSKVAPQHSEAGGVTFRAPDEREGIVQLNKK